MRTRWNLLGVSILCAMLLAAAAPLAAQGTSPATDSGSPKPGTTAPRSEVFFCETANVECRASSASFAVDKLRDLYVFVTWPGVSGDRVQTVQFILPDGSLYSRKETAFRVRAGQGRARPTPGAPVPDNFMTSSRGVPTVVTSLPVAGTYISQRQLIGTWTVQVLLDGRLVASGSFKLTAPAAQ